MKGSEPHRRQRAKNRMLLAILLLIAATFFTLTIVKIRGA